MRTSVFALLVAACGYEPTMSVHQVSNLRADCELAEYRCSRCHTFERVGRARVSPGQWHGYVRRMRLMPGSNIPPEEEPAIARCLISLTEDR